MEPPECLALQGWRLLDYEDIAGVLSAADIMSLAGNAFNAHAAMAMTLAAMATIGLGGFEP